MKIHHSINIRLNYQADECDLAIVSVDRYGTVGRLNQQVLKSYEYQMTDLNPRELSKGYAFLKKGQKKGILFIVTVGGGTTSENLNENLYNAINSNLTALENQRVWVPLMGTGDGKLDYKASYEIILNVLNKFSERIRFFISIPDSNRGVNLYNEILSEGTEKGNNTENFLTEFSPNFYLVGSSWGNAGDQTNRFLNNSIWENGYDEKYIDLVRSVEKGDILLMKSTYAENSISYLRIKGIGVVSNNPGNGQSLEVDWVGLSFINIADLGHYRPTILEPNPNHIPSILGRIEKVDPDIFKKLSSFLSTTELQDSVNEIFIDIEQQILVGLEVGSEIKDYDVIFLPKSSYEGIGRNGIAAHILQLLNSDRESFRFSDRELKELKFKWDYTDLTNKRVELGFIVSKGEDKNEFDFSKNLQVAINNFQGPIIKDGKINPPVKVFIPMLGTGQAGMSVDNSFEIIKDAIPAIKNQFRNSQIRINFPREIEPAELKRHIKDLLSTHKLQAVDKLNLKIDQLYRRDAESESETNIKDKIPFHLDNVETVDKLNRDPVAESLARLINKDIFDKEEMNHSFMVHLQGEWGSGKSTFLNLIENHLNTKERKWIVIKFNAWQNQHISPPWWSFIDQIYRQSRNAQNWHKKIYLFIRENSRRIIRYSSAYKAFTFSISILLILILFNYGYNIIDFIKNTFNPNDDTAVEDFKLTDISDILVTFSVILGIIIAMAKFFSTPILMNSAEDARSFLKRATNPMAKIKRHFESLISDINFLKYDIAVFIDDIDRCNREYTVELLEGIQTLFKNRKVLYIIAGDTKWITSCFENNYSEFSKVAELQGQNLGELFLEKAFQLSVRMPDVSEESKQAYWKEIIGDKTKTDEEKESYKEVISAVQRERIKQRLVNNYNQNNNSEAERSRIEEEFNISKQQVAELAIEGLDENVTDVRHLLLSFHNLISPNPRSIKRLANNYSMYRNTLIAEDTDFKPGHLFRWLLLEDKYPMVVKHFLESNTLQNLSEFIEKKDSYIDAQIADLNTIIQGRNDSNEEVLKIEELNQILRK